MNTLDKRTVINIFILIVFMILTLAVGIHHEPWADEAQAWLIARDCTFKDIILSISKYEGTPALWFCLLRCLNYLHFPYEQLYLISWVLGSLGVFLLLFKSKLPDIIRYSFPFTYFIFYQYTVLARNYSLIFPLLAIIGTIYLKRLKHPLWYTLFLVLLANASAYGFVIAFVLSCFFTLDVYKSNKNLTNKLLLIIIPFICALLTALYAHKAADCIFPADFHFSRILPNKIIYTVTRGYFNNVSGIILYIQMLIVTLFYVSLAKAFCKNRSQVVFFAGLNLSIAVILSVLYCSDWHSGYLICTLIFTCWILAEENSTKEFDFNKNKILYAVLIIIFSTQIFWSLKCAIFDYNQKYCAAKEAADFLKTNNLARYKISAFGFHTIALNPYFKENIFSNMDKSYWEYKFAAHKKHLERSYVLTPVVVVDMETAGEYSKGVLNRLANNYVSHKFSGVQVTKGSNCYRLRYIIFIHKTLEENS